MEKYHDSPSRAKANQWISMVITKISKLQFSSYKEKYIFPCFCSVVIRKLLFTQFWDESVFLIFVIMLSHKLHFFKHESGYCSRIYSSFLVLKIIKTGKIYEKYCKMPYFTRRYQLRKSYQAIINVLVYIYNELENNVKL